MTDPLEERLAAVERAIEGDRSVSETSTGSVEERCSALEDRMAELEAAVEAVEGYVGHVERTDDALERRANAALAAVDDLETRVASLEESTGKPRLHRSERPTPQPDDRPESKAVRQPRHDEPGRTASTRSTLSDQRTAADGGQRLAGSGGSRTSAGSGRNDTSTDGVNGNRDERDWTDGTVDRGTERDWTDDTDEQGLVERLRERL